MPEDNSGYEYSTRSNMRFWVSIFTKALERAYGLGANQAFLTFNRRRKPQPSDLICDPEAYDIAEKMAQDLRESAKWGEERLRGC